MSDRARKLGDYGAGGQTSHSITPADVVDDQDDLDEDCEDCAQLGDGWVCAECYIKRGKNSEAIDG